MNNIFLSLGSNLGNKKEIIDNALIQINRKIGSIIKVSSLFETEPWGFVSSNSFYNICIEISSSLSPFDILYLSNEIEKNFNRLEKNTKEYKDRTLDIDILFYSSIVLRTMDLTIPHREIDLRKFVLEPLNEIAYDFINPLSKKKISVLLDECTDNYRINKIEFP